MRGIYLGLPIWGANHVALWHNAALPAMLAPGNLPFINRISPTTLLIYTSAEDKAMIERSPLFERLIHTCAVEMTVIGETPAKLMELLHPGTHHAGTCFKNCQNMIIERAWKDDCGYICWSADTIWSNSGGAKIVDTLNAGKRALMYVGYGIHDAYLNCILAYRGDGYFDIPPDKMSADFLATIGGGMLPPSIEDEKFGENPGNLRWSTGDGRGMLLRPHHVNIGFIHAEHGPIACNHGVDHELAELALSSRDQVLPVFDTSEHMVLSVNALGTSAPVIQGRVPKFPRYSREHAAIYLKVATSEWHRYWMQQHWWCQSGNLPPDDPVRLRVEDESDAEIAAILETYNRLIFDGGMTPELALVESKMRTWDY